MGKGATKTPWEYFMTAASSMDRINRNNKTKKVKTLTLKQQLDNLDKSLKAKSQERPKKAKQVESQQFSYAPDVLTEDGWNHV